jgi:hypothetical protein
LIEVFIRRQAEARGAVFVTIGFFVLNDPATAGWNENRIAAAHPDSARRHSDRLRKLMALNKGETLENS